MSEANKPPATNRGVMGQKDKNLTAVIDWCQVTVKSLSPISIAEDLLKIPYRLLHNDKRKGIKGYAAFMCFDDIRILEPRGGNEENGYQVLMSGEGCRNYERILEANGETWYDFLERVLQYELNIPRLDIAIDDKKTYFSIPKMIRIAKKGYIVTRMQVGECVDSIALKNGGRKGTTLRLGSRSSGIYMVFYEKNYEQAKKRGISAEEITEKWNRYELRFKQEKAVEIARELVERRAVCDVVLEVLNASVRFVRKPENSKSKRIKLYPLWEPWEWFIKDVGKLKLTIKPRLKDYYTLLGWVEVYVAPTLKMLNMIDQYFGLNNLEKAISKAKLNEKHYNMIESCKEQIKAQEVLFKENLKGLEEKVAMQKEGWLFYDPNLFEE